MIHQFLQYIFGLMLALAAGTAFSQAAIVQSVKGSLWAQDAAGTTTALNQGQSIQPGTQLVTGDASESVLKFADGHIVALKDNSTVKLASYVYNQQQPASSSFVMELVRGGLRSVTGLLGKANPQAFRVVTSVATIGIRGSDWMTALQGNDLYTGVNSGGIAVNNASNTLLVDSGQFSATLGVGGNVTNLVTLSQLPAGIFGNLPSLTLAGVTATGTSTAAGGVGAGAATSGAVGGFGLGTAGMAAALAAGAAALAGSGSAGSTTGTTGTR